MSYGVGLRNGVAFALGTIPSLTSGGGLRPSLLLNFLSGTLDSRITFSRGTQATQYTSNGTLQYAPNNLLTYSNQADNAAWTKSNSFVQTNLLQYSNAFTTAPWNVRGTATATANSIISPDGTSNGWLVTGIGVLTNDIFQQITVASGVSYSPSFWIKRVSVTGLLQLFNPAGSNGQWNINLALLSDNWERITATHPAVTVATPFSGSAGNIGGVHFLNTFGGTLSFYLYGAQVVLGSVPGDYVATTSAALPVLYADYQGKLRARKLCENTATADHYIVEGAGVIGNTETISVYAKAGERNWLALQLGGSSAAYFNLSTGVKGTVVSGTSTISSAGNGYYRCTLSAVRAGTTNTLIYAASADSVVTYAGDGSSGIYIADAQLEAGSTVQAYNDTTSAAYYGPRFDYDPTNYVRQNLLLQSQTFDNASWITSEATVVANTDIAPDGTLTADKFIPSTTAAVVHTLRQSITVTGGAFSIYAKAAGETTFSLWFVAAGQGVFFDLAAGTTSTISGGISSTITNVGNGWYRCTGAFTGATTLAHVYGRNGSGFAGDGTSGVLLWGAQLNTGSTALTYTATTTAPYTLVAARGLLIEESRANLLLQSNDFQTSWSPTNITRTLASTTGPDGTLSGVKIEATTAAGTVLLQAATVAATTATFSVYAKQGTGPTIGNVFLLRNNTTATNLLGGNLNYSTGVFTYTTGSTGATVTNVGNGWWRVQLSVSAGITSSDLIVGYVGYTGIVATAGDFLYAYGAQLEAGAFATSYIPTVGSSVTRNADSASITTLTPWFNATQGTLYAAGSNFVPDADSTVRILAALTDTISLTNAVRLERVTNLWRDVQTVAGVASVASGTWTFGTNGKLIGTYQSSNSAGTFNGATPTAVGTATMPSGITSLGIGCNTSTGNSWNGWITNISYYPTRLPNATLQGLTV